MRQKSFIVASQQNIFLDLYFFTSRFMTTNNPGLTMNDFGPTWTKNQHKQRALLYRVDLRYTSGGSHTTATRDSRKRGTAVLQRSIAPILGLHCFLFFPSLQQHLRGRLPSSKRIPKSEKSLNLVTLWAQFQAVQRGVGSGLKAQCFWGTATGPP